MGKGKSTLPPLDDSILQMSSDDKNDEVKPGLVQVQSHRAKVFHEDAMLDDFLFSLQKICPKDKASKEKPVTDIDRKKDK